MNTIIQSALILLVSITLKAQEINYLTDMPAQWKYYNENNSGEWYDLKFYKMNAKELNEYQHTTEKLDLFFGTQAVINSIRGINLNAHARCFYNHYDHELVPVKPEELVKANLFIGFCSIFEKNGKPADACMEVPYIDVKTNCQDATYEAGLVAERDRGTEQGEKMHEMFFLPKKLLDLGEGVYLYDFYYDNVIVVARDSRPYWIPVKTQEYIDRSLAYHNMNLQNDSHYQMVIDQVKKEIAMVPPVLLNQPVYVSNILEDRKLLGICTQEEDGAHPMYRFNPEYFDPALPRTKVQLITISIPGNLDDKNLETENDRLSVLKYISTLKGSELKELLD